MDQDKKDLTKPEQPKTPPAEMVQDDDGVFLARWKSSLPCAITNLTEAEGKASPIVTKALGVCDKRTRDVINETLPLVGYVGHVAELTNKESGEVVRKFRAVLLLDDGRTVSTMSDGVIRALRYLANRQGPGKWTPPIMVKIRQHKGDGPNSFCDMIEVESTSQPTKAAGTKAKA